jgi:hypothetical protein
LQKSFVVQRLTAAWIAASGIANHGALHSVLAAQRVQDSRRP